MSKRRVLLKGYKKPTRDTNLEVMNSLVWAL